MATTTVSFLVPTAQAATKVETLHEMASRIAIEHSIPPEHLFNLIQSESKWNPSAKGDYGCSMGLTQINTCKHDISSTQALDPETNLEWAAKEIEKGNGYWWTSGNCYSFVWLLVPNLPHMAQIIPNEEARVGSVAIFYYKDKETGKQVKHVAYVTSVNSQTVTIREANFEAFKIDTRVVDRSDPHLVGFWG